jgi:ZIP family zinc transporter
MKAFLFGLLAASSLILGAAIALVHPVRRSTLGLIMAFGSGVLISAVAYDLVADAFATSGAVGIPLGLLAGALAFFLGDLAIDRAGGTQRKSPTGGGEGAARAIVLGTILDGLPESIVIGLSLISGEGVSVAVVVAVFLSNLPEAMAASTGSAAAGRPGSAIIRMWVLVALASAFASWVGFALLADASAWTVAFVQSFAAGALLTMLADTMMPEAFTDAGPVVGLATTLGFLVAFAIASWEHSS